MSLSINTVLVWATLIGIVQTALITVALLLLKRGWRTANRVLAALFAVVFICNSGMILSQSPYALEFPHLLQVYQPFNFLIGPVGYLYVRTLFAGKLTMKKRDAIHGLPLMLCAVYFLPFYLLSAQEKIGLLQSSSAYFSYSAHIRSGLLVSQQVVYLILCLCEVRRSSIGERKRGPVAESKLLFAKILLGGYSVFVVTALFRNLFVFTPGTRFLVPSLVTIFICGLIVVGLLRPKVFTPEKQENDSAKYLHSSLSIEDRQRHAARLVRLMTEEKPYINPELTLERLAQQLSILPLHLSQVINQSIGKNFADFVNSYRVEEFKAKSKTTDLRKYKIASIAEACGFKSKSTFYTAFKKHTGETPSEFLRDGRD
jgi:AraC-like DNA-binding protein